MSGWTQVYCSIARRARPTRSTREGPKPASVTPCKLAGLEMHKSPTSHEIGLLLKITGRLPTLPHTCACSTIGAEGLNYRVRDGNGWVPFAKVTQNFLSAAGMKAGNRKNMLTLRKAHFCLRNQ